MPNIIYKITNIINNKIYIGKTTKDIQKRFREHQLEAARYDMCQKDGSDFGYNSRLYPAMLKYGVEAFNIEIVNDFPDIVDLNAKEIEYIELYKSTDPNIGYNISRGGMGGPLFKGHNHSAEMKIKQSQTQSGKRWYNNGVDEIMILKGMDAPDGFKLGRLYKGLKGKDNPMYGKKGYNFGKHLSEETKKKLSETKKKNNATRTKVWVTNGVLELQIDLNREDIPAGFTKGRLHRKTKLMRQVQLYDINNNLLSEFESLSAARSATNVSIECIISCCKGRTKTAGGYRWRYKDNSKE